MEFKSIVITLLAIGFTAFACYKYLRGGSVESERRLAHFSIIAGLIFTCTLALHLAGPESSSPFVVYLSLMFFPLCLALPVAMYMYVVSLYGKHDTEGRLANTVGHYGPAALLLVVNTFSFIALYVIEPDSQNYNLLSTLRTYINFFSLFIAFLIANVVYLYKGYVFYNERKAAVKTGLGGDVEQILVWMKMFMIAYAMLIVILYLFQVPVLASIKEVSRILLLCYLVFIVYFGGKNTVYYEEQLDDQTLDNEKQESIVALLEKAMVNNRLYLEKSLTLQSLSAELNTNTKYLSYVINQVYKKNFSSYINEQRIAYAQQLFLNNAHSTYTIETISKMTGFKSKSAFNYAFKKYTNMTPTQYITSQISQIQAS